MDRLALDIGAQPDTAKARALTQRLPISVRIEGLLVQLDTTSAAAREWRRKRDNRDRHSNDTRDHGCRFSWHCALCDTSGYGQADESTQEIVFGTVRELVLYPAARRQPPAATARGGAASQRQNLSTTQRCEAP